jgi:hypothetical protein
LKVCHEKIRVTEIRPFDTGGPEVNAPEVGPLEIRPVKIDLLKIAIGEIHPFQVRPLSLPASGLQPFLVFSEYLVQFFFLKPSGDFSHHLPVSFLFIFPIFLLQLWSRIQSLFSPMLSMTKGWR